MAPCRPTGGVFMKSKHVIRGVDDINYGRAQLARLALVLQSFSGAALRYARYGSELAHVAV